MARPSRGGHSKPATLATTMSMRIVSAPMRAQSKQQLSQSAASVSYSQLTQALHERELSTPGLDEFNAPEAHGRPVLIDGYLPYAVESELPQGIPAGIPIEVTL